MNPKRSFEVKIVKTSHGDAAVGNVRQRLTSEAGAQIQKVAATGEEKRASH